MQHFNCLRFKIISLVFAIIYAVASLARNLLPCHIFHQSQWPLESTFSCRWQCPLLHRPRQAQFFALLHNWSIFTRLSKFSRRLRRAKVWIFWYSEVCMCLGWSNQSARCQLRHLSCDFGYGQDFPSCLYSRWSSRFLANSLFGLAGLLQRHFVL